MTFDAVRLQRVEYHLFEHDVAWLSDNPKAPFHDVDREVCLIGDGEAKLFVSWVQDRHDFHVEWSNKPFFLDDGIVIDFSEHILWADLIGKDIGLDYVDAERLAIRVLADNAHVYLCAYEQTVKDGSGCWGFDGVHVSKILPERLGVDS